MPDVKLTKKEEKEYLRNPQLCPICGSANIGSQEPDVHSHHVFVNAYCKGCKSEWVDTYTLTEISDVYDNREETAESD